MRALCNAPMIRRSLLAAVMALSGSLVQAAPEQDPSLKDIPMPVAAATSVPAAATSVPVAAAATCPAKASLPTQAELQQWAQNSQDRGLLWRISHGGRSSWLYGTIHTARREWLMPGRTVMGALYGADKLALELNVLDPEVVKELSNGMKARDDLPELTVALNARLENQRKQACAEDMVALRPDAQVIGLLGLAGRAYGLDPSYGVDMMLAGMAHGLKKPLVGLETPKAQLDELFSSDPVVVEENVSDGLTQLESGKAPQMLNFMADLWADGKQEKLENYADWCDCANTPRERAQLKRLMDDRNPGMADGIVNLLKEGTVFAAVGALHTVGPNGLPTLLRKKGYKVERVKFKPRAATTPKDVPR